MYTAWRAEPFEEKLSPFRDRSNLQADLEVEYMGAASEWVRLLAYCLICILNFGNQLILDIISSSLENLVYNNAKIDNIAERIYGSIFIPNS